MAAEPGHSELERFLAERADHLLRTAVLLAGNREAGEDLLQTAVERLARRSTPWSILDAVLDKAAGPGPPGRCHTVFHPARFARLPAGDRGLPVALQVRAAGHRAARQFAAVDGGEVPADRGLLRNTDRGQPQSVDGIEAIKLTSRPGSFISETIWVSPSTYLPVRVVVRSASGAPAVQQTADITWLSPTAQNLAKLTVPIPAGFRKVSLSAVAAPTFKQISPALLPRPKAFCLMPAVNACGNPPFPVGGPPLGSGYR